MDFRPSLVHDSEVPLYRQVFEQIASKIRAGELARGERLPATRELAGQLGLNRTTISAAYELLEAEGLIAGQVGRGSFVTGEIPAGKVDWPALLERPDGPPVLSGGFGQDAISFVMSRPPRELFPLDEFRAACQDVLARPDLAGILQLGSPSGYPPLRQHLLDEARRQGIANSGDDVIVTNGCQQALDLIGRILLRPGDAVAVEDPIYTGLKNLLISMGARLVGVPVGPDGLEVAQLQRVLERERPRFLVVTSNFQNPTGATMPLGARLTLLEAAGTAGVPILENDAYGELRYSGEALPAIKQLDHQGGTVLLRSFSKVSFPGLRVGWAVGPKPLMDRLRQAKEAADLHTDQLSQAVLLEFARIGKAGGASRAHARGRGRAPRSYPRRLPPVPASRDALDPSRRRHEHLGAAAGSLGCWRVAVTRPERRRGLSARTVFRRLPAGARRAAFEFCGIDPRTDRGGSRGFRQDCLGRARKRLPRFGARIRDGLRIDRHFLRESIGCLNLEANVFE